VLVPILFEDEDDDEDERYIPGFWLLTSDS
jgi:hypothetical protein